MRAAHSVCPAGSPTLVRVAGRASSGLGAVVVLAAVCASQAPAQPGGVDLPGLGGALPRRLEEERPELPPLPADEPAPVIGVPPPEGPPGTTAPPGVRVLVRSIRIQGATVFTADELGAVAAPYVGRYLGAAELEALRRDVTLLYVEHGYITSGARLPDQPLDDGVLRLRVVEGRLARIDVEGLARLRPGYVRERIARAVDAPLRIQALEEQMRLLQRGPLITGIDGRLAPGDLPGESVLTVEVEERTPYRLVTGFSNHRSPSVGSWQGELHAELLDLSGLGDSAALHYVFTQGIDELLLAYRVPLSWHGPTFGVSYKRTDSKVIENPTNLLDIRGEARDLGVSLSHPLFESLSRQVEVGIRFDRRRARSSLLGQRFSFAPGVQDGMSRVSVLRLVADWVERRPEQVLALRSVFNVGLDVLGATHNDEGPDGRFFSWIGQLQWARRFGWRDLEALVRADVQLAADPLLPLEKFKIGGARTVRGYRESLLARDSAAVASVELRVPVVVDRAGASRARLAAFADWGRAWNRGVTVASDESIASAGLGLLWNPVPKAHAELYGAIPFDGFDFPQSDLQDAGVHFRVTYELF